MKIDDPNNVQIVAAGFAQWYKGEIDKYVARCDNVSERDIAVIVRNVSQFAMGRLVTELQSVGMSVNQIIEFLSKHATS